MRARSAVAVHVRGAGPARERWYRSLAYALAATASSSAVFESTADAPVPWVTIRPRSVIEAFPKESGVRLEIAAAAPPPTPPVDWRSKVLALVAPFPRIPSSAFRSGIGRVSGEPVPEIGQGSWAATQTHWVRGRSGDVWLARRFSIATRRAADLAERSERLGAFLARDWSFVTGGPAEVAALRAGAAVRDWHRGGVQTIPAEGWWRRSADGLVASAESPPLGGEEATPAPDAHGVVFGASGAGKTTYLATLAARAIASGARLVVIDLHGDLAPAIVARLEPADRSRVIAIDLDDPPGPGIASLGGPGADADASAAHLVAALKRLSPDGQDVYWGFRLERLFDAFVRLAQESGGSLLDVYDLLTDPVRREAVRLATRREDLARFLDELAPIVRRQPEFLWSAAARLAKVVLVPALADLLAPRDGGIPVEPLVTAGRSLLVRIPFARLGPEAAGFAGSLVLCRCYLGLAAQRRPGGDEPPILVVLDEAHAFAPRLVAELLTESRKFGIRVLLATQFPDRLAPEVRAAAAGAPSEFVTFRLPPAIATTVGAWLGLPRDEAERWLPTLGIGEGVRRGPGSSLVRPLLVRAPRPEDPIVSWSAGIESTRAEFGIGLTPPERPLADEVSTERLLLAVLAAEEERRPIDPGQVVVAALTMAGPELPPESLGDRWGELLHRGLVTVTEAGCQLTEAGARRLGLTAPTGATRESAEHRALLLATFRLFARRGYRIEIVRQGRFDTTLPDAIFRQLARRPSMSPADLAAELDRIRGGWAWRFFGGRDVHVEVEVSGALRAERIRRGWVKARQRNAFALFVVGDAARARRVRGTLQRLALGPDRAQVWTVRIPARAGVTREAGTGPKA